MPLPAIQRFNANQCQAKSKRSGERCQNLAAFGMSTCRMHGARKPETILRGADHPQYKHGKETLEARENRRQAGVTLHALCDLGNEVGLFNVKLNLRGRRPKLMRS